MMIGVLENLQIVLVLFEIPKGGEQVHHQVIALIHAMGPHIADFKIQRPQGRYVPLVGQGAGPLN